MADDLQSLKGTVLQTAGLVNYQEGSIVSRMITYSPQGTVTVFAFAQGSGLSEHTAPYDAILEVLEGTARITLDGVTHTVTSGELMILPAHILHAVHADVSFKMMLTMIHA
jgi:quercetin dioxygenase-like cupin family protein